MDQALKRLRQRRVVVRIREDGRLPPDLTQARDVAEDERAARETCLERAEADCTRATPPTNSE